MYIVVVEDERGALVSEHELTSGQLNIGRASENDIILASGSVSRNHACLYIENGTVYIADMGSSNGVVVDDVRIKGESVVNEAHRIRLGDYRIVLEKKGPRSVDDVGISTSETNPENAHGRLVVLNGRRAGQEVLLYEPVTGIGRTDENDVSFPDISISRHHARLVVQDDGSYVLSDLGSSNGTFYNGRRLTSPFDFDTVIRCSLETSLVCWQMQPAEPRKMYAGVKCWPTEPWSQSPQASASCWRS